MPTFHNPVRVDVTERGRGFIPWEALPAILLLAAVAWTAHKVAPYAHVLGVILAIGGTLGGCAVLALAGWRFAQWERRRKEPEPLRYRTGERIREPRR